MSSIRRLLENGIFMRLLESDPFSVVNLQVTSLADYGPGTLRNAIVEANIGNATYPYNINIAIPGIIVLLEALPALTSNININGLGSTQTTIQSAGSFGVFSVTGTIRIYGLTISGGNAGNNNGGGIYNNGNLGISSTVVSNNSANSGGGIYNNGNLTIVNSMISNNNAHLIGGPHGGGGLSNVSIATITGCSFTGNTTSGSGVKGGAIYTSTINLTIENTSITGNSSSSGGGIYASGGFLYIGTSNIISGNTPNDVYIA